MNVRSPLPGGGPWLVLPNCPAKNHNTLRASRGNLARNVYPCICPRGRFLFAEEAKRRRAKSVAMRHNKKHDPVEKVRESLAAVPPDLYGGACTFGAGQKAHYAYNQTPKSEEKRKLALDFCHKACVKLKECRTYILKAEFPGGSWGGIHGGMTPYERRQLASKSRGARGNEATGRGAQ